MRVQVLDAIVAAAEAPEQIGELLTERRVDAGELGGQFVALSPGLLVGRAAPIVLLGRPLASAMNSPPRPANSRLLETVPIWRAMLAMLWTPDASRSMPWEPDLGALALAKHI